MPCLMQSAAECDRNQPRAVSAQREFCLHSMASVNTRTFCRVVTISLVRRGTTTHHYPLVISAGVPERGSPTTRRTRGFTGVACIASVRKPDNGNRSYRNLHFGDAVRPGQTHTASARQKWYKLQLSMMRPSGGLSGDSTTFHQYDAVSASTTFNARVDRDGFRRGPGNGRGSAVEASGMFGQR